MGQRPHNLAAGNARGTGIKASEAVPEFTANAFADHHRRIRLASLREPKTMTSLRCRGGMPSTTPHIMGNDKAHRARPSPPQPHSTFVYFAYFVVTPDTRHPTPDTRKLKTANLARPRSGFLLSFLETVNVRPGGRRRVGGSERGVHVGAAAAHVGSRRGDAG